MYDPSLMCRIDKSFYFFSVDLINKLTHTKKITYNLIALDV